MSSTNADIGRRLQVPGFLATPYDDCAFFQSQSTDLVVFSPSTGEYVTIAWYVNLAYLQQPSADTHLDIF